jgi:hypothetical protein
MYRKTGEGAKRDAEAYSKNQYEKFQHRKAVVGQTLCYEPTDIECSLSSDLGLILWRMGVKLGRLH